MAQPTSDLSEKEEQVKYHSLSYLPEELVSSVLVTL